MVGSDPNAKDYIRWRCSSQRRGLRPRALQRASAKVEDFRVIDRKQEVRVRGLRRALASPRVQAFRGHVRLLEDFPLRCFPAEYITFDDGSTMQDYNIRL